jgi:S1-C subfamily serine protease
VRPIRRAARSAAALAALAALVVAGCGGGGGARTSSAGTTTGSTPAATGTASAPATVDQRATALDQALVTVVKRVAPAVVQIQTSSGLGSGIVFDGKGDIVTNAHVVGNSQRFTVTLADGKNRQASLVGSFPADDLAVIRTESSGLTAASFGDSSKLEVGAIVLAIGNPLGLRSSVTQGIVSSTGRTVSEGGGVTLPSVIQTSAPINPGNSGGALVDLNADVIGIPTLAATDPELGGAQAPGIGFAIPSNMVKDIAGQLIAHGRVVNSHRAYLGVDITSVLGGGVLVAGVVNGGPAANAGIKPGDIITALNGQPTPNADALSAAIATDKPGDKVKVSLTHADGSTATVTATLGQLPGG